jgi:hypothetical protein
LDPQLVERILTGAPVPESHVVDGIRYLCHAGDHYCQPAATEATS